MSLPRDDAPRSEADDSRFSPTTPLRPNGRRPAESDGTAPLPAPNSGGINRITPHLSSLHETASSTYRRGQAIGDYEIVEELARGGMGVVYKAYHSALKRTVALKMILRGDYARLEDFIRFRTEALAIARLHHPNLVNIFEISEHDGLPFYAMEYLEGGSLADRIRMQPLAPRAAAQLMLPLARAIDYAHSRGIIHRDLKPANILLSDPTLPLESCVAKVTDFGVAKELGGADRLTRTGDILGTPAYMAPEQAIGRGRAVGPAADVYSLGAILYESLTGKSPFHGSDGADTILRVLHEEPTAPRKLNAQVPADLETICLKCLEKNPSRRYPSAAALAEDLRLFLADEPILARPSSLPERTRKWVRRRPVFATALAAGAMLAVLAFGSIVALWQQALATSRIEADLVRAKERNLVETKTLLADALLERGITLAEKHDIRRGMHWMIRSLEVADAVGDRDHKAVSIAEAVRYNLTHWSQFATAPHLLLPHDGWAWAVGFSPDGSYAVTGGRDRNVRVWNTRTGQIVGTSLKHDHFVWDVAVHPSGQFLFAAGGSSAGGEVRGYKRNAAGLFEHFPVFRPQGSVRKLILTPDGKSLAALQHNGGVIVYAFNPSAPQPFDVRVTPTVEGCTEIAFSADGSSLYMAMQAGFVRVFDIAAGKYQKPDWDVGETPTAMALSPDRRTIAVGIFDLAANQSTVHLWRPLDGLRVRSLEGPGFVKTLGFSADGRDLAASFAIRVGDSFRGKVRVVRLASDGSAQDRFPPLEHARPVWSLAFAPSGESLVTGCEDGQSRIWDTATGELSAPASGHEGNVVNVTLSQDGRWLLTASAGGNATAHAKLHEMPRPLRSPRVFDPAPPFINAKFQKDGAHLLVKHQDQSYATWNWREGRRVETHNNTKWGELKAHNLGAESHIWAHDPKIDRLYVYDPKTGDKILELPNFPVHWEDQHSMVVGDVIPFYHRAKKQLILYDADKGVPRGEAINLLEPPLGYFAHPETAQFGVITAINTPVGPDQAVVTGSNILLWDLKSNRQRVWTFKDRVYYAMFSPRGDTLALHNDFQVKIVDTVSGAPIGPAISHDGNIHSWFFHPTENVFGFGLPSGEVSLWHTKSSKPIGKAINLGAQPAYLAACPDGSGFLGAGQDRRTYYWKHLAPKLGSAAELKAWIENLTGSTLDANDELISIDRAELHERRRLAGL